MSCSANSWECAKSNTTANDKFRLYIRAYRKNAKFGNRLHAEACCDHKFEFQIKLHILTAKNDMHRNAPLTVIPQLKLLSLIL